MATDDQDEPLVLPPVFVTRGDRVPPRLMRRGTMEQAKHYFLAFLRHSGDVRIATHRVGRSPLTILGYRASDPGFAAAWDVAQKFNDDLQAGRLRGETGAAVDVTIDSLHQDGWAKPDPRLKYQVAKDLLAKTGIGDRPETEPGRAGPVVTTITIRQQPAREAIPVESRVLEDDE